MTLLEVLIYELGYTREEAKDILRQIYEEWTYSLSVGGKTVRKDYPWLRTLPNCRTSWFAPKASLTVSIFIYSLKYWYNQTIILWTFSSLAFEGIFLLFSSKLFKISIFFIIWLFRLISCPINPDFLFSYVLLISFTHSLSLYKSLKNIGFALINF